MRSEECGRCRKVLLKHKSRCSICPAFVFFRQKQTEKDFDSLLSTKKVDD